ncbi:MAG TPA: deoxyribodipyrimidine photo-lyase [Alphaproteobacteria bacterium]|nr:deoxyribodipyrimidine photo-lyase [Alphaproteobacteria bacterium]
MTAADSPALVWFRQDLRLADNPALAAAVAGGRPVLAVYVLDDETPGAWRLGGAARWWLHHSLAALAAALRRHGVPLVLRRGPADLVVADLARRSGAVEVHWNRLYEPHAIARDAALKADLTAAGIAVRSHNGTLLREPWEVRSGSGGPYRVFTPFWRACLALEPPPPCLPAPAAIRPAPAPEGDDLDAWSLLPTAPDWAGGLRANWTPGEAGAAARLAAFVAEGLARYGDLRNRPDVDGSSRLSPHLRFGEVSPRQVWHAVRDAAARRRDAISGGELLLREIGWREFSYHLLYHAPSLPDRPLDTRFERFPWAEDEGGLAAWQQGRTGYPIVDAGMRQLWHTGWMHNRVRMISASTLTKSLLLPWQLGAAWFWDTLVDADLANNSAGWQWVAGCGADAAPFVRVFNPVLQGEKFDPDGAYVRRWVPELARLPNALVHKPWTAPPALLAAAGVRLGETYPHPVVDHGSARERALAAYDTIRGAAADLRSSAA